MRLNWGLAPVLLLSAAGTKSAFAEPLIFDNGRAFLGVVVNGVPTEALLDSGAEATLVDDDFAVKAQLPEGQPVTIRGTGGEQTAIVVTGVQIAALGTMLRSEMVVVMDLEELSTRLIRRPTNVVLGREIFDAARLQIDILGGSVHQVSREEAPLGVELPLTAHAGIESFPISINGIPAQAEFDLGNGSGILVSRKLAEELGLKVTGQRRGGGIGGEVVRSSVRIPKLEIAGVEYVDVAADIDDQPNANDLNIGTSVLKDFLITTDFPLRRIWLAPRGGERG